MEIGPIDIKDKFCDSVLLALCEKQAHASLTALAS
jgi:hypothetical protein